MTPLPMQVTQPSGVPTLERGGLIALSLPRERYVGSLYSSVVLIQMHARTCAHTRSECC